MIVDNFEKFMTTILTEAVKQSQTGQVKPTPDMYTELAENLWKTFNAFCEAGFAESQSFELLKTILGKGVK